MLLNFPLTFHAKTDYVMSRLVLPCEVWLVNGVKDSTLYFLYVFIGEDYSSGKLWLGG